jgi:hypothetical protein
MTASPEIPGTTDATTAIHEVVMTDATTAVLETAGMTEAPAAYRMDGGSPSYDRGDAQFR